MTTPATRPVSEFLPGVLKDPSWRRLGHNLYFKEVDGKKVGVIAATPARQDYQCLLNRKEFERPLKALTDGRLDAAYVIVAKSNGTGQYEYLGAVEIRRLWETVLKDRPPQYGRYGEFWILDLHELVDDDDLPF
jgi:hypothetical protein